MALGLLTVHEGCKMQTQNYHKSDIFGTLLSATVSISWGTVLAAAGAKTELVVTSAHNPQPRGLILQPNAACGSAASSRSSVTAWISLRKSAGLATATAYSTLLTSKSTSIKVTVTVPQLKKKGQEIWQKGPFNRQIFRPNLKFNFNFNIQNFLLKVQCFMSKNKQNQITSIIVPY